MKMDEKTAKKSDRIIRMPEVRHKTGLCNSTIYDLTKRGIFPPSLKLIPGGRAAGKLESQVDQWILELKESSKREGL
jgi:prophage regulatory protein